MPERHPYLDGPYPRAYAHRGWHLGELAGCENTLAALRRAVDEGFGYLELDVHATADGVAVVHHDAMLDRTTDASGAIGVLPAAEVAHALVAGREPVPTLAQVLAALPHTRMTIDLKSRAVVEPVLALLARTDSWDRVCLGSFYDDRLHEARRRAGPRLFTSIGLTAAVALRTRAWLDALPWPLAALPTPPVDGLLAQLPPRRGPLTVIDRGLVRAAHRAGMEVHGWTVDDPALMNELLAMGVDGLVSDRPDLLRDVLVGHGCWAG